LLSDSDSDGDDYTPHYILDVVGNHVLHYDYMPFDSSPPAIFSQDHKGPPVLTAGALTPALLRAFQIGSMQYFSQKTIAIDKQVASVVWGLRNPRIQNWYMNDTAHIDLLTFNNFMKEIRSNWLTDGWEGSVEQGILNLPQGDMPFWDWLQGILSTNALIVGTYAEMDEAALRTHIKSKMNQSLKEEANHKKTHVELDFKKWTTALQVLDEERINDERKMRELLAKDRASRLETRRENARPLQNPSRTANTVTNRNASTSNSSSTTVSTRLPPLTQNERSLLAANSGCFKCRLPFVDHRSPTCPNPFPTIDTYKTITEAVITAAKARVPKKPVATVVNTETTTTTQVPIAVVMPNVQSCVLGDGSDSEYVAPLHTSHFRWDCYIGSPGTSSDELVNALIDNGSHAVLIRPEEADRLGLVRHKLPVPEEVELAMVAGSKRTFTFVDYVKLAIVSSDQSWSSCVCRAIVAPGLCVPLLLGGPFLSFNKLVMDHEL